MKSSSAISPSGVQNDAKKVFERQLMELHHRVKNTLQNIISYSNIMTKDKTVITKEDILKLSRYIQSLSLLSDLVFEELLTSGDSNVVRLDQVIARIVDGNIINLSFESIPVLRSTPRVASSLSLVLNELLGYAASLQYTEIQLSFKKESDKKGLCSITIISNDKDKKLPESLELPFGIIVAQNIAKADFDSVIEWEVQPRSIHATLHFPLSPK